MIGYSFILFSRICLFIIIILFSGTYALKPPLPAVGGGDGVGRVLKVGDQVKKFKPGDLVK